MLHEFVKWCFQCVHDWGYTGIVLLMAMESSIFPVPSEIVMPPAAYWAAQGKLDFWWVVVAGTVGSYLGSAISYWVALWVGRPLVEKYGKYFLMPPQKIALAERWAADYGIMGVFLSRLLPVVRHLISIPAGILRMPFGMFSVVTVLGAGLWCFILTWWGGKVLGDRSDLMDNPDAIVAVVSEKKWWFVGAVVVLGGLFWLVLRKKKGGPVPA